MKVRVKQPINGGELYGAGYYNHQLFKGGEEFELTDPRHFSDKWMEKVDAGAVPAEGPKTDDPVLAKQKPGPKKFVPVDLKES